MATNMEEPTAKRSRSADTDGDNDFRFIKLDMKKYGEEVRRLSSEDLVGIFEIGLKVRESLSVVLNQNVLEHINENIEKSEKRLAEHIGKCQGQVVEMANSLKRSHVKGSIGEIQVMKVLKDHFGNFTITNVSAQRGKGDILVQTQRQQKIMIEVKNRESNVPQTEIDRFKRDLESSTDVKVGILFSVNSGIANKASNGKFEVKVNENKYQIYVPNAGKDKDLIIWSVLMADELTQVFHGELGSSKLHKLEQLYDEFQDIKVCEKTCRSNLDSLENAAKSLRENMNVILKNVDKTRKKLKSILNSDATDSPVATVVVS